MPGIKKVFIVLSLGLTLYTPYVAAEEVLRGRLFSPHSTGVDVVVYTPVDGIGLKAGNPTGYVFFEDGRIAQKQWVFAQTNFNDGESGEYAGFSVLVFENGDSMTLAFEGGWDASGITGVYNKLMKGTGAYENATVRGTLTGVLSPWEETQLTDMEFIVTRP